MKITDAVNLILKLQQAVVQAQQAGQDEINLSGVTSAVELDDIARAELQEAINRAE